MITEKSQIETTTNKRSAVLLAALKRVSDQSISIANLSLEIQERLFGAWPRTDEKAEKPPDPAGLINRILFRIDEIQERLDSSSKRLAEISSEL